MKEEGDATAAIRGLPIDVNSDHILIHLLAQSDAGVVPFGHNIRQPRINYGLDQDIGIIEQKFRKRGHENRFRRVSVGL